MHLRYYLKVSRVGKAKDYPYIGPLVDELRKVLLQRSETSTPGKIIIEVKLEEGE